MDPRAHVRGGCLPVRLQSHIYLPESNLHGSVEEVHKNEAGGAEEEGIGYFQPYILSSFLKFEGAANQLWLIIFGFVGGKTLGFFRILLSRGQSLRILGNSRKGNSGQQEERINIFIYHVLALHNTERYAHTIYSYIERIRNDGIGEELLLAVGAPPIQIILAPRGRLSRRADLHQKEETKKKHRCCTMNTFLL